ncbi:MAG: mannose-1-phosphate guanylyltransferase [Bacteroidales bacterium]|nr:mannose-1-phosphate guanylyltransferase [Bacteroidales bacterium]
MNRNNYCIIMAGGVGGRFWPMSTPSCPKQFLDLLGTGETMLQTTVKRFEQVCPQENIFVVTGIQYKNLVKEQIPYLQDYQIVCEPSRRNTAPCIAYAGVTIKQINPQANIIVSPSDHAIFDTEKFTRLMKEGLSVSAEHDWIITFGIEPTSPNTKYGYIQFNENSSLPTGCNLHKVITFTEKPPFDMAQQFIRSGDFLWNSGIFIWNIKTMEESFNKYLPDVYEAFNSVTLATPYSTIENIYSLSQSISIDYGVIEKASNVHVMIADFGWSDVETWASLYETRNKDIYGNAISGDNVVTYDVKNSVIHVPKNKKVILQGLENYIVAESDGVLMICNRNSEHRIFKFASDMEMKSKNNK